MLAAGRGDLGYSWRMQDPRSLDDIDLLIQRKEQLREALGAEIAGEVLACPENFADADAFRIYHAKARFRATMSTALVVVAGTSLAAP